MALPILGGSLAAGIHVSGGFIPLAFAGDVEATRAGEPITWESDEGGRTLFVRPSASRSWAVSSTVPRSWARQAGRVRSGAFGHGPWAFVDPEALRTNALRAGFPGEMSTVLTWDGEIVPAHLGSDLRATAGGVIPGQVFTGSAVTSGTGTLVLEFLTASGAVASAHTVNFTAGVRRPAVTATAPATAAQARVRVSAASSVIAGAPQVTLGTQPGDMSEPAGVGFVGIEWGPHTWDRNRGTDDDLVGLSFTAWEVVADG